MGNVQLFIINGKLQVLVTRYDYEKNEIVFEELDNVVIELSTNMVSGGLETELDYRRLTPKDVEFYQRREDD